MQSNVMYDTETQKNISMITLSMNIGMFLTNMEMILAFRSISGKCITMLIEKQVRCSLHGEILLICGTQTISPKNDAKHAQNNHPLTQLYYISFLYTDQVII